MAGDVLGVVEVAGERPDRLGRSLDRLEPVEGDAEDEEFDEVVRLHLVPVPVHRVVAVEDRGPGGGDEEQAERQRNGLDPLRDRGQHQVVRTRPQVAEDEGPEGDDGEPVAVDRQPRGFRQEVVEHREDREGEDRRDGVVSVPPLDVGVVHADVCRVRLGQAHRDLQVVEDVDHRHRDHAGDEEPEGDVHLFLPPPDEGPHHVGGEHHPQDHHHDVEGPLELRVLLGGVHPGEQGEGGQDDGDVEQPELGLREARERERRPGQLFEHVEAAGEDPGEGEPERQPVGVDHAQATEGEPRRKIEGRVDHLGRQPQPDHQADQQPEHRGEGESPNDGVASRAVGHPHLPLDDIVDSVHNSGFVRHKESRVPGYLI